MTDRVIQPDDRGYAGMTEREIGGRLVQVAAVGEAAEAAFAAYLLADRNTNDIKEGEES